MRYVSPEGRLAGPEAAFDNVLNRRALVWDRARRSLGGGRFWSVLLVLLLTFTVARSTSTVQWVGGIEVVNVIALLAAVLMSVLALSPIREWIGLGIALVLAPVVAVYGAWPQIHHTHPTDVIGPQLVAVWWNRITDGSAALVLVSGKWLDRHGIDKSKLPRMLGFGSSTDYLALEKKDAPTFTTATKAAEKAFGMAKLTPRDMHGVEVHDCFSITEICAYEILGLADRGKGAELAMSGATALPQVRNEKVSGKIGWEIPINAGGGLIGDGHPVGATGVRQVVEAYQHLTEQAGARQIPGAKKFLTFNMGGSLTTSVAMIWGRD